ncbi:unnamed protein product [Adineta steineri]|uniref:NHL repeat containing protein n=1 Tax=Adineta steineri TaxID=433720 RepID=A0A819Q0J6_9BILA|nr:unnamed protein product [Adineta steineri]
MMNLNPNDQNYAEDSVIRKRSFDGSQAISKPGLNQLTPVISLTSNDNFKSKTKGSRSLRSKLTTMPIDIKAIIGYGVFIVVAIVVAIPIVCLTEPKNTNTTTTNSSGSTAINVSSLRWMLKATTVAGISDEQNNDDKRLSFCTGLALDLSNGIYVSDYQNNRIQKWAMYARRSKTVAGQMNGTVGSTMATLNFPTKVTVDLNGNIYVTDSENHRVQLWSDGGLAGTTVAGTGRITIQI